MTELRTLLTEPTVFDVTEVAYRIRCSFLPDTELVDRQADAPGKHFLRSTPERKAQAQASANELPFQVSEEQP